MTLLDTDYLQNKCKKKIANNRYLFTCLALLTVGGMPEKSYALASPDDTIRPYVASSLLYDSNFLRLSDSVNPVLVTGKSDKSEFIKQITAGIDTDWTVSRQHIIVKANVNQNWFQNFTTLNYTGWDTQAQWNWHIKSNLDGHIGYANIQTMGGFGQLNQLIGNIQNNQRSFADGGYLFHPNGKINLGIFRTELQYHEISRKISNNIEDNAEITLQYLSPTGSVLGVRLLATDGQYPNRQLAADSTLDNAYTRMNYATIWDWHASSKTRINGLIGYTYQDYTHFSNLNFADIIADLSLNWQASTKTLLELSTRRLVTQANNQYASFVLTQGVWFSLNFQYTPKIILKLPISYQQQQYLGGATNPIYGQQKDNVGSIGLNLMYYPWRSISIGSILKYENRDSNNYQASYGSQSAGVNLQAEF